MKRKNPTKKIEEAPLWLINTLKVLLLIVFVLQFVRHIPEGYIQTTFNSTPPEPPIETIAYHQVLGTTLPTPTNHLYWGEQFLPYQAPDLNQDTDNYYEISAWKIKQLSTQGAILSYKGQNLHLQKVHAIFLQGDLLPFTCEVTPDSVACLDTNIQKLKDNFEVWIALETVESKIFYSKLKVGNTDTVDTIVKKEAKELWKKLIKKEVYKDIDILTVAKPVFIDNQYLFKWGEFERPINKYYWEKGIKIDLATFKEMLSNGAPKLYAEDQFIPFHFSIGFWNKKRFTWEKKRNDISCNFPISEEHTSIIQTYPCFEEILDAVKAGDILSFFLYIEEDFLKDISTNRINNVPEFILNGRKVTSFFNINIVEEAINPRNRPLELTTSEFSFQLNTLPSQKARVKIDTLNPKNKSLLKHYKNSNTTEIVHIPNFKTIRRVLTYKDQFIPESTINHTDTLVEKIYAVHTFPEFHDFDIFPPLIKSRGLSAVLDKTFYNRDYFVNYRDPFEMWLGSEKVKILQTDITLIPKEGEIIRYITDNPDRFDINRRIDLLPNESSIYFDNILFERENGEQLAFPLAVAIHLQ